MKKLKKIVALAMGTLMSVSIFTGCSKEGLAIYKAYSRLQRVRSAETKTDISLNVSAENLSEEEYGILSVLPAINASKISMLTKSKTNEENTASQVQSDYKMQLGAMPIDMSVWVDVDFSKGKNVMKEIIKMPNMLTSQAPQFKDKEYMVMDLGKMINTSGTPEIDYEKMAQIGKELQPKLEKFVSDYVEQYNSELDLISKLGSDEILVFGEKEKVNIYELKLNDKNFKDLVKYTVNNLGENKEEILNFLKEYFIAVNKIVEASQNTKMKDEEVEAIVDEMLAGLPEAIDGLKQGVNELDNIKIFGDKGINIQFAVNNDGYIVNEKGSIQFVIDANTIMNSMGAVDNSQAVSMPKYTGIYTITVDFNTEIHNINKDFTIEFPEVNEANSVDYMDLINVIPEPKPENSLEASYKNAYESVKMVKEIATKNNVKPSFFKFEDSLEAGVNDSKAVANAVSEGLQFYINDARAQVNNLPDSLLDYKKTFSSILDNYQNPVFESINSIINSNSSNPKQDEIILARILISDVDPVYKSSYSTALDKLQQKIFDKASELVDKAVLSKSKEDIDKAVQAIEELKNIPEVFSSKNVEDFILSLEAKLK